MDDCGNCKLLSCTNCPIAEPEKTLAERFTDNLEIGWDYAIEQLELFKVDGAIFKCMEYYWKAYRLQENDDIDAGKCFEIRQWAINEILKRLEEK